ncbi:hypothetical protein T01_11940 [Trichinella spiralis]|uniref:Uncharacterized protein n=1 Tax=Trichinella spiralis TaxID=6334 RepID=A0A0V1AUJ3_TRISP|nr:hypothetical protein T01_11940 [Trichinella spiralis]
MTTRFYHGLALLPGRRSPPLILIVRLSSQVAPRVRLMFDLRV